MLMVMAVIMLAVGVYVLMGASEYARKGVKTEAEITSIVIGNKLQGQRGVLGGRHEVWRRVGYL